MKKIFLIGDSISLHYGPYLARALLGKAELHTKEGRLEALADLDHPVGGNGGDSSMVLQYLLGREEAEGFDADLFVFNCGLHDIKRDFSHDCCQISVEAYAENLKKIVALVKSHGIKTAFITSTPVEDDRHNARVLLGFRRYDADLREYNRVARAVMEAGRIPVIGLGEFTRTLEGEIFADHVHYIEEVRQLQAAFLAGRIEGLLE